MSRLKLGFLRNQRFLFLSHGTNLLLRKNKPQNFARALLFLKGLWPPLFIGSMSAILFNLAFPGGPAPSLAWISMLPIMIYLDQEQRPWLVSLAWTTYGVFFWLGALYWLYFFMRFVLEFNKGIVFLLLFVCFIISAVPYSATGYLASKFAIFKGKCGALKLAALLSAFVTLWPVPFPGDLSMSFYRTPILTQIADIGGAHFIHFVIIWVNGLLAEGLLSLMQKQSLPKHIWISLLGISVFVLGYGYFRLNQFETLYKKTPISEFVRIGYVQPNLPGHDLTSIFGDYLPDNEKNNKFITTLETTLKLVEKESGLDLIAWPETPKDLPYIQFSWIRAAIADFVYKSHGVPFLFESMHPWTGLSDKHFTTGKNSIYLIKNDELSHPYHKVNLIPFSEYLPGEKRFPILRKMFPSVGDVIAGDKTDFIQLGKNLRIIPLICYDAIFPEFVRKFALTGGNVFLSLDNDTNFGPTKASEVHASVILYRAIENRIPLIRLSNPGASFTVLSSGKILPGSETKRYEKAFRAVTILPGLHGNTIYQCGGFYFPYILIIVFLGISFSEYLLRRRKSS